MCEGDELHTLQQVFQTGKVVVEVCTKCRERFETPIDRNGRPFPEYRELHRLETIQRNNPLYYRYYGKANMKLL